MSANPQYTPRVMRLARDVRTLTIGEMLALREALRADFDLPPDIGVREPREPKPSAPSRRDTTRLPHRRDEA